MNELLSSSEITFIPESEGGRATPPLLVWSDGSYRPHIVIGDPIQRRAIIVGTEIQETSVVPGATFTIREGARIVGFGRVIKLFVPPDAEQSLAADGAMPCFSSNFFPSDRMLIARRS